MDSSVARSRDSREVRFPCLLSGQGHRVIALDRTIKSVVKDREMVIEVLAQSRPSSRATGKTGLTLPLSIVRYPSVDQARLLHVSNVHWRRQKERIADFWADQLLKDGIEAGPRKPSVSCPLLHGVSPHTCIRPTAAASASVTTGSVMLDIKADRTTMVGPGRLRAELFPQRSRWELRILRVGQQLGLRAPAVTFCDSVNCDGFGLQLFLFPRDV